jgi:hypothetical protein
LTAKNQITFSEEEISNLSTPSAFPPTLCYAKFRGFGGWNSPTGGGGGSGTPTKRKANNKIISTVSSSTPIKSGEGGNFVADKPLPYIPHSSAQNLPQPVLTCTAPPQFPPLPWRERLGEGEKPILPPAFPSPPNLFHLLQLVSPCSSCIIFPYPKLLTCFHLFSVVFSCFQLFPTPHPYNQTTS